LEVLKKYAVFHGRARRKEYWMFILFNFVVVVVLSAVEGILGVAARTNRSILVTIYELATLVPALAVGVRRMHDTDHSGWWLLFPIVNFVFAVSEGQRAANRFGPDPKLGPAVGAVGVRSSSATEPAFAVCPRCGFEQWEGYSACQKCGAAFK